jgi:hypothetical protein
MAGGIHQRATAEPRKFYIDGGEVEVIGHLVYDLDTDGKKLQVVKYTEYSGRAVRTLYPTREALQSAWANPDTRSEVLRELTERGISFEELAASSEQPDADPFDLLCHLAWNAPLLTRRQRAEAGQAPDARPVRPVRRHRPRNPHAAARQVRRARHPAVQHAVRADEGPALRPLRQSPPKSPPATSAACAA